ncbi:hypothetical protein GINT2_001846 [Glugoides intestinalis]
MTLWSNNSNRNTRVNRNTINSHYHNTNKLTFRSFAAPKLNEPFIRKLKTKRIPYRIKKTQGKDRIYTRILTSRKKVKAIRRILKETEAENSNLLLNKKLGPKKYKVSELTVITLNINHIHNKIVELTELLYIDKPHVIQLQETHRNSKSPKINWPGYNIIESFAQEERGFNGLITAVRTELYGSYTIEDIKDNFIEITFNDRDKNKISLFNVYIPTDHKYKEYVKKITKKLDRKRITILIGDWNTCKKQMSEELTKLARKTYLMNNEIPGSRRVQGNLTNRLIDYSIVNAASLIINETHLVDWNISDHIPVRTIIKWENNEIARDKGQ